MGDLIALRALVDQAAAATEVTPEQRAREAKSDACELRRQRLDRLELPDQMRAAIIAGNLKPTKATNAVHGWRQSTASPVLLLSGPTGRGKTVAVLQDLSEFGGHYTGAREFSRVMTSRWSEDVSQSRAWMTCALLVIDDIGRERDAGEMQDALLDVLDARPSTRKRTVLVTNLDKAEWVRRYPDERLRSRLAQLACFVGDAGPDMRRSQP